MASRQLAEPETKYTVYSSDAGKGSSDNSFVLPADTLIDKLVSSLESKSIVLASKPEAEKNTPFDSSDKWAEWLSRIDESGEFSLVLDPTLLDKDKDKALQSFSFGFTVPFKSTLTFSSSAEALKSSFGEQAASTIQLPGVDDRPMLYCGLLAPESDVKTDLKELFEYVGLSEVVKDLPSIVVDLQATLAAKDISEKRNAMWFEPAFRLQTTIRLQFELDAKEDLEKLFHAVIPGFVITDAAVIGKKILTEGTTEKGPVGVDGGAVIFDVGCALVTKNNAQVPMRAGIEFSPSSVTLTLRAIKAGALEGVVKWLEELISGDLGIISSLIKEVFDGINLQQVIIGLSTAENKDKPALESFRIDVEIAGNFGQDNNKKPVFLASLAWRAGPYGGMGTSMRAQLWTTFDTSPDRILRPFYEKYGDLQPFTNDPGTSINLETLIPNEKIDIPERVPSSITRASLILTKTGISIGASIKTKKDVSPGDVPQPYLGEVDLDASYAWDKTSEFTFKLGILAGIEPSKSSTHTLPAALEGTLSYTRSS